MPFFVHTQSNLYIHLANRCLKVAILIVWFRKLQKSPDADKLQKVENPWAKNTLM